MDIVERLRFDATRCEAQFSRGVATNIEEAADEISRLKAMVADLAPFLAIWAVAYQRDYDLDGLHPVHYDMLAAAGVRMDDFKRATNARH